MVGNAIITVVLVLMIGGRRRAMSTASSCSRRRARCSEDKIVNIPARAGNRDIADLLQREGVIDVNPWAFIGGVFALKASSELKPGEY